mgnify:CR=1 FL=1
MNESDPHDSWTFVRLDCLACGTESRIVARTELEPDTSPCPICDADGEVVEIVRVVRCPTKMRARGAMLL